MIDMSVWEEIPADVVDELHLDPRNVRLGLDPDQEIPEPDIIQDLVRNEDVLSLIDGISKIGYLTVEDPIVVIRDGKMVVVEGNRRIAALKLIQNPYLALEYAARISKLVQAIPNRDGLKKVIVKIAPNQDDADQLIAALHTSNQRKAWGASRQAAFFQAQIDGGKTLEQLLVQYPTIDVKDFIIRSQILTLFREVRYSSAELTDYVKSRRFPVSTLARLYENDNFLELAQIKINRDRTRARLAGASARFGLLANKIINDIKRKRINTRVLNTARSESYIDYMDELRQFIDNSDAAQHQADPGESKESSKDSNASGGPADAGAGAAGSGSSGSRTGSSNAGGTGQPGAADSDGTSDTETSTSKSGQKKRLFLDTESLEVPSVFPQPIHAIFHELSDLNITRFPNATMDLLRTFLEKTVKSYAEAIGEDIRDPANQSRYVYLADALKWLENYVKNSQGQHRAFVQVISKIRSSKLSGYTSSMDHLNAVNHNHHISASTEDVRESWNTMKGLVGFLFKP